VPGLPGGTASFLVACSALFASLRGSCVSGRFRHELCRLRRAAAPKSNSRLRTDPASELIIAHGHKGGTLNNGSGHQMALGGRFASPRVPERRCPSCPVFRAEGTPAPIPRAEQVSTARFASSSAPASRGSLIAEGSWISRPSFACPSRHIFNSPSQRIVNSPSSLIGGCQIHASSQHLYGCAHEPPDSLSPACPGGRGMCWVNAHAPRPFSTSLNSELNSLISIPVRRGINSSFIFGSARVVCSVPSTQETFGRGVPTARLLPSKKEPRQ